MQSQPQQSRKFRIPRGISIFELIGCLAALVGGVVLGLVYLGVDVQAMAVEVLEKAEIEVPTLLGESSLGESSLGQNSQAKEAATNEATTAEASNDTYPLTFPGETASPAGAENGASEQIASNLQEPIELTNEEKLAATQTCWVALNEILREEAASRSQASNTPANLQVLDGLTHRKNGHQKVAEAIEQLDHDGVDPRLGAYIQQAAVWHRSGENIFGRAVQLLASAPSGKLAGPFAQSWQSAATQHRMEEKLLLSKHAGVASYLQHARETSANP